MVTVWFWWCMGLTAWAVAGPAFCWFAGKEAGRGEALRSVFAHPSVSRPRATIETDVPVDDRGLSA